jgi:transposase
MIRGHAELRVQVPQEAFMSRPKQYRKFTKDFKVEAVKLCLESGKTIKQVAEDLGIPVKSLEHWRRQHGRQGDDAFRGNGHRTAVQMELRLLRKEVAELRMERDILKKAAAWFAKQQL